MAKDGGNSLIMLGGLAVAGYFAYEYFFKGSAAPAAGTSNPGAGSPGATGAGGASQTPAASALDALYVKLKADVVANADPNFTGTGDALSSTPYRWVFYLQRNYTGTIPDVSTLFADTNVNVTAAQFWAVMAPALKAANAGLTGLGFYGGLGAIVGGRW